MKRSTNIRAFLIILFKHKIRIFGVLFMTLLVVGFGTYYLTPVYQATSVLLVKFGREYVYQPEVGETRNPSNYFNRDGIINAEIEILNSQDLRLKLVNSIGIKNIYPDLLNTVPEDPPFWKKKIKPIVDKVTNGLKKVTNSLGLDKPQSTIAATIAAVPHDMSAIAAAEQKIAANLTVMGNNKSNIIRIAFLHENPRIAADTTNALVDLFQEKHLQTFSDPKTSAFLSEKVNYYRQVLRESEEKIAVFKQKNMLFSYREQLDLLLQRRAERSNFLEESKSQLAGLQEKSIFLEQQLKIIADSRAFYSPSLRNRAVENAKNELLALQLKELDLLSKFNKNNQKVVSVQQAIKTVKTFLREQVSETGTTISGEASDLYQEISKEVILSKTELRTLQRNQEPVAKQIKELDEELRLLTKNEGRLQALQREFNVNNEHYQMNQKRLEETLISDEMDRQMMTNIRVVQRASIPAQPSGTNKSMSLVIGAILGLFAGLAYAFFREYISQVFNSEDSVTRRLDLPVLVTVSRK